MSRSRLDPPPRLKAGLHREGGAKEKSAAVQALNRGVIAKPDSSKGRGNGATDLLRYYLRRDIWGGNAI